MQSCLKLCPGDTLWTKVKLVTILILKMLSNRLRNLAAWDDAIQDAHTVHLSQNGKLTSRVSSSFCPLIFLLEKYNQMLPHSVSKTNDCTSKCSQVDSADSVIIRHIFRQVSILFRLISVHGHFKWSCSAEQRKSRYQHSDLWDAICMPAVSLLGSTCTPCSPPPTHRHGDSGQIRHPWCLCHHSIPLPIDSKCTQIEYRSWV